MDIVFTDLDGTLLDHETYSFEQALPGIALLKSRSVPLVFCSSKTRSEMEYWRAQIGNRDPFIVENGGAIYIPQGCFASAPTVGQQVGEYRVVQLGTGYNELVRSLRAASAASGCAVRGFHQMTAPEVSGLCNLGPRLAELAKQREFDEPFLVLDPERESALVAAIEDGGKHFTRGGRFCHITGNNDKALAVQCLLQLYRRSHPAVRTVGLGDGLNDAPLLNLVDIPVLIRGPGLDRLRAAVPNGRPTAFAGPLGWNEAIAAIFGGELPSGR